MRRKPTEVIARSLVLIFTLGLAASVWAALPVTTVTGSDVTVSNESGNSYGDIEIKESSDTFTIAADADAGLNTGTRLRIKSVSFAPRSGYAQPTYISLASVNSSVVDTSDTFATANMTKYKYSFEDKDCVVIVGTESTIAFYDSNNEEMASVGLKAVTAAHGNYFFGKYKSTQGTGWAILTEVEAEIVYTGTVATDGSVTWDMTPPSTTGLNYKFSVPESATLDIGTLSCDKVTFDVASTAALSLSGSVAASSSVTINGGRVSVTTAIAVAGTLKGNGTLQYVGALPTASVVLTDSAWTGTLWLKDSGSVGSDNKTSTDLSSVFYGLGNADSTVRFTNVKAHVNNSSTAAPFTLELVDGEGEGEYAWYNNNGWTGDSPVVSIAKLKGTGTFYDEGNAGCRQIFNFTDVSGFTGTIHVTGKRIGFGGGVFPGNDAKNAGLVCLGDNMTIDLPSSSPKFECTRFALRPASTLTIRSGNQSVGFADQGIRGTVTIAEGATLTATTSDAMAYNTTGAVNVYGTLAMGAYRWTFGPGNTLNLYSGATVTGSGDAQYSASLDMNLANGTTVQVSKVSDETSGTATISAPIRSNQGDNGKIIVDEGMTLVCAGRIFGNHGIKKQGAGRLVIGYVANDCRFPVWEAGTIEYLFGSLRDFSTYADGTFAAGSSITLAQTKSEFGEGSTTVTGLPENISVTLNKADNTSVLLTVDENGTAQVTETPVISGSTVCWHDYEFNNNYDDVGFGARSMTTWSGTHCGYLQDDREGKESNYYAYTASRPGPSPEFSFGTEWSAAIRCTVPQAQNAIVVMFGRSDSADMIGLVSGASAGQVKLVKSSGATAHTEIATMAIASPTTSPHVFVFTKTADYVNVYCDGKLVKSMPVSATVGAGLQFGTMYRGFKSGSQLVETTDKDTGGIVDYMRLYDFAIGDRMIQALADEEPYVSDAPIYTRTVSGAATWNATDSWTKADSTADEPDPNGRATLTAEADSAMTVNVAASPVYESLTFDGNAKVTLSLGEGSAKLGAVALNINTDVEMPYTAFDLTAADISIADGKTLTVDYTGYDFSGIRADASIPLSAAISGDVHADRIVITCDSSCPAWIYALSAAFNDETKAYVLKVDVDEGHYNVWTAEAAGSLAVAAHWKDGVVPTSADDAQINNGVKATLGADETFAAKNLFIGRGYVRQQNATTGAWENGASASYFSGAEVEMSGGTFNIANELWIGSPYADGHDSALSASAGTITAGALKMGDDAPGTGHKNVLTLSGAASLTAGASQIGIYGGSINEVNVGDNASLAFTGDLTLGSGSKVINVNGGTLAVGNGNTSNNAKWLIVNNADATINLNAGELSICRMTAKANASLVFNGGMLTAYGQGSASDKVIGGDSADKGVVTVKVKNGGAIINTVGNTTITPALEGDAESVGGGLTKKGDGTLTLTAAPTFTGAITVEAGKLVLPVGTYNLAAGTVVESQTETEMTLVPGVAITVPSVDNTTVTVMVGNDAIAAASDGRYYVVSGSTVTVAYAPATTGFVVANGAFTYNSVIEATTVDTAVMTVTDRRTYTWTGEKDRYWNNPGNWSTGLVPTSTTPVTFPTEGAPEGGWVVYVGQDSDRCASMTVAGNVTLTKDANQSDWSGIGVAGDVTGNGTLTLWRSGINSYYESETTTISCPLVIKTNDSDSFLQKKHFDVTGTVEVNSLFVVYDETEFKNKVTLKNGAIVRSNGTDWYGDKSGTAALTFSGGIEVAENASASFEANGQTVTGEVVLDAGSTFTLSAGTSAAAATFTLGAGSKLMVPAGATVTEANILPADASHYVVVPCAGGYTVADANYEITIPEVVGATATVTVNDVAVTPENGKINVAYGAKVVVTYTANEDYAIAGNTVTIESVDASNKTISTVGVSCWVTAETWTGAGDGKTWKNAANWNHGVVPNNGISVTFLAGNYEITVSNVDWDPWDGRDKCGAMTVDGNVTLKNEGGNDNCRLAVFGNITGNGSLTLSKVGLDNGTWDPATTLQIACKLYVAGNVGNSWFFNRDIGFAVSDAELWGNLDSWSPSSYTSLSIKDDVTVLIGTSWTDGDNVFHQKGVSVQNISVAEGKQATFTYSGQTTATDFTLTGKVTLGVGSSVTVPESVTLDVNNDFVVPENYKVTQTGSTYATELDVVTFTLPEVAGATVTVTGATNNGDGSYTAKVGATVTITWAAASDFYFVSGTTSQNLTVEPGITVSRPAGLVVNPAAAEVGNTTKVDADYEWTYTPYETAAEAFAAVDLDTADDVSVDSYASGEIWLYQSTNVGLEMTKAGQSLLIVFVKGDKYADVEYTGHITAATGLKILCKDVTEDYTYYEHAKKVIWYYSEIDPEQAAVKVVDENGVTVAGFTKLGSALSLYLKGKDGYKIILQDDVEVEFPNNGWNAQADNITIDLNGHTVSTTGYAIYAAGGRTITIDDSSEGQTGKITSTAQVSSVVVARNATVVIAGGEIEASGANSAVEASDTGSVEITGGKITGSLSATGETATIAVSGGTFSDAVPEDYCAEGFIPEYDAEAGTYGVKSGSYVAQVGDNKYETLVEAVAQTQTGTITILKSCSGAGIFVAKNLGKNITIDLGGYTYTCSGPAVGSTGTATQAFHLEKGNTITLTNGKVDCTSESGVKMLVQNYSDLTLDGMTLDGTNLPGSNRYVLSNNNGNVVIDDTTITAKSGDFAFDVCRYSSYKSVNVTVTGKSIINGNVEISASEGDAKDGFSLTLDGGTMTGDIVVDNSAKAAMEAAPEKATVTKAADFTQDAPEGYKWEETASGDYKLVEDVPAGIEVEVSTTETIVAVPAECTAATLINTANRAVGDQLKVYNKNTQSYYSWQLAMSGDNLVWDPLNVIVATSGGTSSTTSPAAGDVNLTAGQAVWVTRVDPTKPIVLNGEYPAAPSVTVSVEKGWNLVAPLPNGEATYSINAVVSATAAEGDRIVVPTAGVPYNLTKGNDGKWGYDFIETYVNENGKTRTRIVRKTDVTVPSGTGFWYINGGDSTKDISL